MLGKVIFYSFEQPAFLTVSRVHFFDFYTYICATGGHVVAQLVEARRHKPEGRGFDVSIFHLHNPSGRTIALGLTQPLTEMSTRCIS